MDSDRQKIEHLLRQWRALTAAGDVGGLLALITDDVVFLTPGNPPIRKADFAEGFQKVSEKARIFAKQDVNELHVSGDLAYVWSQLAVTISPKAGGPPTESTGHVLTVFRKDANGEWRLARDANLTVGAGNPNRV